MVRMKRAVFAVSVVWLISLSFALSTVSNSDAPAGALWVEGTSIHWADGSTEYYFGSGSAPELVESNSPGPLGALWIEGSYFHWIDQNGDEQRYQGVDTDNNPSGASPGNVWLENSMIHYIDASGNERKTGGGDSQPVSDSLVMHWDMDDGSGTVVKDTQGTLDGDFEGSPQWSSTSMEGQSVYFQDGDYIGADGQLSNSGGSYSVSMWVKTTDSDGTLVHRGSSYGCDYTPRVSLNSDGTLNIDESGCSSGGDYGDTSASVNDGNWHHVVIAAEDGSQEVYIDNSVVNTGSKSVGSSSKCFHVAVSYSHDGDYGNCDVDRTSAASFTGYIDEVRFFDKKLTSTEVDQLYNEFDTSGSSFTFTETFTSDNSGTDYTIYTDTWQYSTTATYDSANDEWDITGANNGETVFVWDIGGNAPFPGHIHLREKITNDYPSDNRLTISLTDEEVPRSGTMKNRVRASLTGSSYTGDITKTVSGTNENTDITMSWDDKSSYHDFDFYYDHDYAEVYFDGSLVKTINFGDTSNIQGQLRYLRINENQLDGQLKEVSLQEWSR